MLKPAGDGSFVHPNGTCLKPLLLFLFLFGVVTGWSQTDTTQLPPPVVEPAPAVPDTGGTVAVPVRPKPKPKVALRRIAVPVSDSSRIDSLPASAIIAFPDSITKQVSAPAVAAPPRFYLRFDTAAFSNNPFFKKEAPVRMISRRREVAGKEVFFYSVIGLVLFFAFIRTAFARYLQDLFKIFFRTTLKQRQVKEQLQQSPIPSFLLFFLFLLTASLFINLWLQHEGISLPAPFWLMFLYGIGALAVLYLLKLLALKLIGWLLRLQAATDGYSFVVFTSNKIIGIVLLPFVVVLAFVQGPQATVVLTLALIAVGFLVLYRLVLSYQTVQRATRLPFIYFMLYLAAFEVAPLLLLNKLLLRFLA